MTDDDHQAAWDALMQRFVPIAQDPEQLLGEPVSDDFWAGAQDRERDWRFEESEQDTTPWKCSIYDHLDRRARVILWTIAARPEVHHLIANLAPDGSVERLTLLYARTADTSLVQVAYENGRTARLKSSDELAADELPDSTVEDLPEPTTDDLPDDATLKKIIEGVPSRLLA